MSDNNKKKNKESFQISNILPSIKKALNEDSLLDDVTPVPGAKGEECAIRLMNGIRRAYPEAGKFNGMKKAMLSILSNATEISGFIRELRRQLEGESWHE